jgi:hypothetical protein
MARGWESKSIESQQDDAARQGSRKPELTGAEREQGVRKAGLEMALAQTQAEMTAACRPAHREMLKLRMEAIRAQLDTL